MSQPDQLPAPGTLSLQRIDSERPALGSGPQGKTCASESALTSLPGLAPQWRGLAAADSEPDLYMLGDGDSYLLAVSAGGESRVQPYLRPAVSAGLRRRHGCESRRYGWTQIRLASETRLGPNSAAYARGL